ncbi:delta(1)-pyrroline-2-carboxylate reductase family protein [Alcaligenes faecalis]|uniref:delta(1)-pyrroline-2-carboxylate reductase family protein n=1 Tax=Alcaligenes faecalis TaxID=511 RepID=UPI0005AA6099|nr:delta(1)-pyrroline-2-carboxylate reductase family protein [Alcaligenes faecalis]ATI00700.1 ornithine cyclodeaminase [Alcaligenes faecalis]AYZ90054.1 delta(1)-pyrroline-2-carboxylate reductase family protein [Alcaligenes faecalis]MCX5596109.1 delta(1)-pyrroline-2-carboxylate reductase family protein [Alcaligenes faecalis]QQC34125.1 delta(1)-pyrroline-2-carboxylate reductase family protein [Alcaligenes faecalis]CAJ0908615.1 Delta(1)-pyrroline-2-carboxylate/Delta(1)-piperideine-2-carboxylate r
MTQASYTVLSSEETARALPYPELVAQLGKAMAQYAAGTIVAPTRQVLNYPKTGKMLSMPAVSNDIGVHKLANVMLDNQQQKLGSIQGLVSVYDAQNGLPLLILDAPTLSGRRTAAVSMLGIQALWPQGPEHITLLGYGQQAVAHCDAIMTLYPKAHVTLTGRNPDRAQAVATSLQARFGDRVQAATAIPEKTDVLIALTSSLTPVYHEAARLDRLLIGLGAFQPDMAEFEPHTLLASRLYADDVAGARQEAGDLIQAGVDWEQVHSIHQALRTPAPKDKPLFFKSVGSAAWDLAAARCALHHLNRA